MQYLIPQPDPAAAAPRHVWRRSGRGITLIEVVVAMTCIGIAAMIVLPAMRDTAPEQLRGAAEMLVADMEFAQSASMSHGDDPRVLAIESDNAGYRIAARSAPTTPVTNPADTSPYLTRFGTGRAGPLQAVRIGSHTFGSDNQLGFGVLGQLDQTAAATVTLTCGTHSMVISIDPITGEATIGPIQ